MNKTKEKNTPSSSNNTHRTEKNLSDSSSKEKVKNEERKITLKNLTYSELSESKNQIHDLKKRLEKQPRKYTNQLKKIEVANRKIDDAMKRRKEQDLTQSIKKINKIPKHYLLRVVETKGKLDTLKVHLERNPRANKEQLARVSHLEKKMEKKIENLKTAKINKAIRTIQKNPRKYNQELNDYKKIESKLNNQIENLNKQNDKTKDKEATKSQSKEKNKSPELSL